MSRSLTTAFQNQLSASTLEPFFAVKLNFDSGAVRLWTGYGDITVASETYTGGGQLLNISPVEETVEVAARGVTLSLNGVDSSLVSIALTENYQTRSAKVYLGFLSSGSVVSDPYLAFDGRMDVLSIDDSGETASLTMTVENRLIDLERARERRYTSDDQKLRHPTDTGFDFVASLQEKEIAWGTGKSSASDFIPNTPDDLIPFNL